MESGAFERGSARRAGSRASLGQSVFDPQLVDDILDFTQTAEGLGKPVRVDLLIRFRTAMGGFVASRPNGSRRGRGRLPWDTAPG